MSHGSACFSLDLIVTVIEPGCYDICFHLTYGLKLLTLLFFFLLTFSLCI